MYARNPSIILQNMNFSRYYRYRAQLIYSFDLNIIAIVLEILYFPLLMFLSIITWTEIGYKVSSWAGPYMATGISETTKVWLMILNLVIMAAIFLLLYVDKQTRGEKCKVRHYVITVFLFLFNMYWLISAANGI